MLTWFGWRSDHFTTILSIRCWTFLPYTRVRVALPLSLYICAVVVFAVSSLTYKKKLILETVQCMYGRVSKVIYCLCTFFFFLILQFDIPSWCFMAFYSFLSFFFDVLFAGVFHSHRVDVDVNKPRIETRKEVKRSWKTSKYLSLTVSTCPTIGFQVFFYLSLLSRSRIAPEISI